GIHQPQAKAVIERAGFKFFLDSLWIDNMDRMAMLALSELWWDTTNTFHFGFGEMTMTPFDFTMITGLPIGGGLLTFYADACYDTEYLQNNLGVEEIPVIKKGVRRSWLYNHFSIMVEEDEHDVEYIARAFILYMISCTFFAGTQDIAPLGFLSCLEDLDTVHQYDWGGAALSVMYRSICDKSRDAAQDFGGLAFIWQVLTSSGNLCQCSVSFC
ncbi:hypothetical protein HGI15_22300, partial [Modestobacter lapidis]|nr:hypothetical protein [Modestobacter lapidis]